MITASRIELVTRCDGPLVLPHRDSPNEWSDGGTERHAADESAINAGDVPEVYTARWPDLTWRSEVRYVYDVSDDSAEFCGVGSTRDYGAGGPFRVGGTIDVEGRGPGILVVLDKKSFELATPAAVNPQVRFLALAAARVQPADQIFVAINHELTGLDVAELDPTFDLDLIAHDTRQLLIRSAKVRASARAGGTVRYQTGRWCRWCPAFDACPRQGELTALVRQDDEDLDLAMRTALDDDSAPDVYELYKRVGILHKRIGQSLFAYAAARPIPIGNGRMFGRVEKLGDREYDGTAVHAVVAEKFGRDVADKVVEMTSTQVKFKEVVKALVPRGKFAETQREVFGEVDRRGGMKRKATTAIEEYTAGPRLVTDGQEP